MTKYKINLLILQGNQYILKANAFPMKLKFQMLCVNFNRRHRRKKSYAKRNFKLFKKICSSIESDKVVDSDIFNKFEVELSLKKLKLKKVHRGGGHHKFLKYVENFEKKVFSVILNFI